MKEELKQKGKNYKISSEIYKKFGVHRSTIHKWTKEFGLLQISKKVHRRYTDGKKLEILQQYDKMKLENPALTLEEVFAKLGIGAHVYNKLKKSIKKRNDQKFSNVQL
uniref:Transposase n=1 Tax=Globodera rostochiensis TaxID=31243 RepID=A0A914HFV3_GLORO